MGLVTTTKASGNPHKRRAQAAMAQASGQASGQAFGQASGGRGFRILYWGDPEFPKNLGHLSFPPAILFVRGNLAVLNEPGVAVVGSRNPTDLGRLWVREVVRELAQAGLVIISGGARGIDAEAHFTALAAKGRTIAFLPGLGLTNPIHAGQH